MGFPESWSRSHGFSFTKINLDVRRRVSGYSRANLFFRTEIATNPLDLGEDRADATVPPVDPMPPTDQAQSTSPGQTRWFAEEVQPHEPALRAYLHARFPSLTDHDDLVQEAYSRLLRAHASGKVRYARAFLFTTARNAALDLFRRRRALPVEAVTEAIESILLEPQPGAAEIINHQHERAVLAEAVRALPDRCREVILLRYLDGLSYKEIAVRLGISPETVKVHMAKGLRRCTAFFAARGFPSADVRAEEAAS